MTADTRLKRFAMRAVAVTVLSTVSLGAGAVVTHHYSKDNVDELEYQALEQHAGDKAVQAPKVGRGAVAELGSQDADDAIRMQQPSGDYIHVPKVGYVKVDTG